MLSVRESETARQAPPWYRVRPGLLWSFLALLTVVALRGYLVRVDLAVARFLASFFLHAPSWLLWGLALALLGLFLYLAYRLSALLAFASPPHQPEEPAPPRPPGPSA